MHIYIYMYIYYLLFVLYVSIVLFFLDKKYGQPKISNFKAVDSLF